MRRKKSLLIPAVLAFSLCTGAVVPVLAEETSQTADAADNEQETHTQSATDTSDSPYEKGTITDTDFQSEWLNLKFTPPETVVMNTEEELQSVMKQGQTTLEEASGVELGEDALSGTVYEMMASSISGFPNVSLVVEDASLENMTVDQYFLAAQQMLDATGMGYTYSDVTDIQIAGQISVLWKQVWQSMTMKFFRNIVPANREESLSPLFYHTPQIPQQKQMKFWQLLLH